MKSTVNSPQTITDSLSEGAKYSSLLVLLLAAFIGLVVTLSSQPAFPKGGDLGGGGGKSTVAFDFQMDQERLAYLKKQNELKAAREVWLQTLTDKEHEELLNNVFKHFIAPQVIR